MKTESDIRKRIQQHQEIIDYYEQSKDKPLEGMDSDWHYQNCMRIIAKEQAIINELLIVLEEKQ